MKSYVLLTAFTCCLGVAVFAPTQAAKAETQPNFAWAISAGGTQHDKTRGIAVDSSGNVLLTGEFTGTATFGEHSLTSAGGMDFFLAKVSPQGKFLWVRSGGGAKTDRGYAVAADQAGNSYVTGHFESSDAAFDSHPAPNAGDYDIFVAKYDANGQLVWLATAGGKGYDYGHGIAADRSGNVFATGAIIGVGKFGVESFGHEGPAHLFCLQMTTEGKLSWIRTAEGKGSSTGHGVAVDQQGNCYVGGAGGGEQKLAGHQFKSVAGRDVLVAKFTADGTLAWLHEGYGSTSALIHEITADSAGNVWAAGMFKGELKLGDRSVANQGEHDLLLTYFDSQGNRRWTRTAGGPGIDYGLGIATDGQGNAYLTGSFTGKVEFDDVPAVSKGGADIMIVKYDREGRLQKLQTVAGLRTDHAYTIVADMHGHLYLSGACQGPATFGSHMINNLGSNDIFLAKLIIE
jgi:hypothetical protein